VQPTNLIVILSDERNPKVAGYAGRPIVPTPNLDYFAAHGTRFSSAYTDCPASPLTQDIDLARRHALKLAPPCVPVNAPAPKCLAWHCMAWHKLYSSTRRANDTANAGKHLRQAATLHGVALP